MLGRKYLGGFVHRRSAYTTSIAWASFTIFSTLIFRLRWTRIQRSKVAERKKLNELRLWKLFNAVEGAAKKRRWQGSAACLANVAPLESWSSLWAGFLRKKRKGKYSMNLNRPCRESYTVRIERRIYKRPSYCLQPYYTRIHVSLLPIALALVLKTRLIHWSTYWKAFHVSG